MQYLCEVFALADKIIGYISSLTPYRQTMYSCQHEKGNKTNKQTKKLPQADPTLPYIVIRLESAQPPGSFQTR